MEIIILICGLILGAGLIYFILRPKLRIIQHHNDNILIENRRLQAENAQLYEKHEELYRDYVGLSDECKYLDKKKEDLKLSIQEQQNQFQFLQVQASESAQHLYDSSIALAQEKFSQAAEEERKKYLSIVEEYKRALEQTMQEGVAAYTENIAEQQQKCKELAKKYESLLATTNAAIAAAKRAEEIKQEANFYKIQLSNLDIEEINMLRNITPYLRDREPLNKVIWKVYYEKPTTDLIGRVIGSGIHTGIYKITNLENQMCYVGQAANLADRWKQHIKRGLGAETPTKNKLYPAMIAIGVENFSFEVIEECPRELLDEREDYWQEYFKAKEFGYSIK